MDDYEKRFKLLKEELLLEIRNSQTEIINTQNEVYTEIDKKFITLNTIIEENNEKINNLKDFNSMIKFKIIDNYSDLSEFSKKAKDELFKIDIRMNNIQHDINYGFSKFDKIFTDNLILPGTIGDCCKYSNMREYIEVNIIY